MKGGLGDVVGRLSEVFFEGTFGVFVILFCKFDRLSNDWFHILDKIM